LGLRSPRIRSRDLYLAKGDDFKLAIGVALQDATPWHEWAAALSQALQQSAWLKCAQLARATSVLDQLVEDLPVHGLVGEARAAKLLYLVVTSRLLKRPVSCVVTGPSSAGKSHIIQVLVQLFPPEASYILTAMSERALAYSDVSLVHRTLVLYEAAGPAGDFQSYLIRSLLSEGRVNYETVEKIGGRLVARRITREGPTGLLMTTTMIKLHHELETRLLSIPASDTAAQTKAVLHELARQHTELAALGQDRLAPWHAFQTWLTGAEHQVTIPYARALAELTPAVAVRLRRDFGTLLALIETHAILHQATREKDEHGRIIATITDYAVVRELVVDVMSEAVEAGVTADIAQFVHAVERLQQNNAGVNIAAVQRELGLDKVSAWRRAKKALKGGFIRNLEDRKYRSAFLVLADPLPEDTDLLPSPEALEMEVLRFQATGMEPTPPPDTAELLPEDTDLFPSPEMEVLRFQATGMEPTPPASTSEPDPSPPRSRGRKSGRSDAPTEASGGGQG
jgi:energy-coupling factor transporter ATP-binding protein EcfA2